MTEGPPRPFDEPKKEVFHGQERVTHTRVSTFTEAMRSSRPETVFSFAQHFIIGGSDRDSVGVLQQQSFLVTDGPVHQFFTVLKTNEQASFVAGALTGAMHESKSREVDGSIKVDPETGHVYRIYETDATTLDDFDQKHALQIRNWERDTATVGEKLRVEPERRYLTNGEDKSDPRKVFDFAYGKLHLVTVDFEDAKGQSSTSLYTTVYEAKTVERTPEATPLRWTFPLSLQNFEK